MTKLDVKYKRITINRADQGIDTVTDLPYRILEYVESGWDIVSFYHAFDGTRNYEIYLLENKKYGK